MKTVTAKYARQNFAEIVDEVHYTGKPIQITKSGKPMVTLVSTKVKIEEHTRRKVS